MIAIQEDSPLWNYLSAGQRGLIQEGIFLFHDINAHPRTEISDYSYLVFPFAKAYEGFLKQVFLDCGFISREQYEGTHFRIGRALNPHLEKHLRWESVYDKIVQNGSSTALANRMWETWKQGRNLVFHYFPHNFRALSSIEAESLIAEILSTMEETIADFGGKLTKSEFYRSSEKNA